MTEFVTDLKTHSESVVTHVTELEEYIGEEVLDSVAAFLSEYVIINRHELVAVVLWLAHTHAIEAAEITPYIHIYAPTRESGKTQLATMLEWLCARGWRVEGITPSSLIRGLDAFSPPKTLIFDEVDTTFSVLNNDTEKLRGAFNAGFEVDGVYVMSDGAGRSWEPRAFRVWGPKVFAGIGDLPATMISRSIRIRMEKKEKEIPVKRLRRRKTKLLAMPYRELLDNWVVPLVPVLKETTPALPPELGDREQDYWEPLIAIADAAGPEWATRARAASIALRYTADGEEADDIQLIRDCHKAFLGREFIKSTDLVLIMMEDMEARWATYNGGRGLSAYRLSQLLKGHGILSRPTWIGERQMRGYHREDFARVWRLYV